MTSDREIQTIFFEWVKEKANQKISLVDELAELLNVSKDSAYRRLRGETLLTFDEIRKVSHHYQVSLDAFLNLSTNAVVFNNRIVGKALSFKEYLTSIRENLTIVSRAENKRMIWAAKDVPILHYFQSSKLTNFKLFFWQRTILSQMDQVNRYDPNLVDQEMVNIAKEIWDLYCKIPSVEIWSDETLNITLRQVEYYYDCEVIDKESALGITSEFQDMIKHLRQETKIGRKYSMGGEDYPGNGTLHLFYNEIAIGDNTIYFEFENRRLVFLTYNMLNILSTTDEGFSRDTFEYLENIMQKSIPISASSEKERNKFFNRMELKIEQILNKISNN